MRNENEINSFEEVQKANDLLKAHAVKEGFSFDVSHLSPEKRCELVLRILADYVTYQYESYTQKTHGEFRDVEKLEETVKFLYEFLKQFIKPKEIKK